MAKEMARIHNKNPHVDWIEDFKGKKITIPLGGFIDMELYEATDFMGQYSPVKILPDDSKDPKSFKSLTIERLRPKDDQEEEVPEVFICQVDKKQFSTQAELDAYVKKTYADRQVVTSTEIRPTRTTPPVTQNDPSTGKSRAYPKHE